MKACRESNTNGRASERGTSVVSISIFGSIGAAVLLSAAGIMQATVEASTEITKTITTEVKGRRCLSSIAQLLSSSRQDVMWPLLSAPMSSSEIHFGRAVGFDGEGIVWNAEDMIVLRPSEGEVLDGRDNDGDGFVDECRLIHRSVSSRGVDDKVICDSVARLMHGEVPNGRDDNQNGLIDEPGFCISRFGSRLVLRLSILEHGTDGSVRSSVQEVEVSLRNE